MLQAKLPNYNRPHSFNNIRNDFNNQIQYYDQPQPMSFNQPIQQQPMSLNAHNYNNQTNGQPPLNNQPSFNNYPPPQMLAPVQQHFQPIQDNINFQPNFPNGQEIYRDISPPRQINNIQANFQQDDEISKNKKEEYGRTLLQQIEEKQRILK
jgi:hypothetical protein